MNEFDELHNRGVHLTHKEVAGLSSAQFRDLLDSAAQFQRGGPESAMLRATRAVGGSPLSYALEHVGDLTHRIGEHGGKFGIEFVRPKVESQMANLGSGYGWDRDSRESIEANRRYRQERGETYPSDDEIHGLLHNYVQQHAQVPVYNAPMLYGRNAAMSVGRMDKFGALANLEGIQHMFPNWQDAMSQRASIEFLKNR